MPSAPNRLPLSHAPRTVVRVDMNSISPSPYQPRREFSEASIQELAESIRRYGLLSPLLLRRTGGGHYELIAGERRFRAMQRLAWRQAEAIVLTAYDADCALIALVENLQREQLHYLDEARACSALLEQHGFTQEALSRLLSKSPSAIANKLRLLKLPESVLDILPDTHLTERHARALLQLKDTALAMDAAMLCEKKNMSVRQLEEYIAGIGNRAIIKPRSLAARVRDDRIVINALMDTVHQLKRLGVQAQTRVEEQESCIDIIVSIKRLPEHA